jgi:hypothetical protein
MSCRRVEVISSCQILSMVQRTGAMGDAIANIARGASKDSGKGPKLPTGVSSRKRWASPVIGLTRRQRKIMHDSSDAREKTRLEVIREYSTASAVFDSSNSSASVGVEDRDGAIET